MITNTKTFYNLALEFQTKRTALLDEYEQKLEKLKPYDGSKGGARDIKAVNEDFRKRLTTLQEKYSNSLNTVLDGMENEVNKRGVKPVTDEQLRALKMLRMKKNVTREDLDRTAQTVADNPMAIDAVNEIAAEHGVPASYTSKEMSNTAALKCIDGIRKDLPDWISHSTTYASRHFNRIYTQLHGDDGQNHLVKRVPFEDEKGCFKDLAGLSADKLPSFADAVNGDVADGQ